MEVGAKGGDKVHYVDIGDSDGCYGIIGIVGISLL